MEKNLAVFSTVVESKTVVGTPGEYRRRSLVKHTARDSSYVAPPMMNIIRFSNRLLKSCCWFRLMLIKNNRKEICKNIHYFN